MTEEFASERKTSRGFEGLLFSLGPTYDGFSDKIAFSKVRKRRSATKAEPTLGRLKKTPKARRPFAAGFARSVSGKVSLCQLATGRIS